MRDLLALLCVAGAMGARCDRQPEQPPRPAFVPPPSFPSPTVPRGTEGQAADRPPAWQSNRAPEPVASQPSNSRSNRCVIPLAQQPPPRRAPATRCPADPIFGGVRLPIRKLTFPDAPATATLDVELATTAEQQQRGLMYRTHMPEDAGMLFVFGAPEIHTFWMRDTCISLDMMFITDDGVVAGIVESAPTLDDDAQSIPCPVSYVLEVNAGWSRRHGVAPGQRVNLPRNH